MKVVILSAISGSSESIIPYGLNLAKKLESEVDILHVIDPRVTQGVASAYADSKSIAAGHKFTHAEIIQREKDSVNQKLDSLLSREVSKLNYPLKVNVIIEKESIGNKMDAIIKEDPLTLFVINQEPDNHLFLSSAEMINICKQYKGVYLFVPSGFKFCELFRVVLPADFGNYDFEEYKRASVFLNHFNPDISAIGKANVVEESEIKVWVEKIKTLFFKAHVTNYQLSSDLDFDNEFIYYVKVNEPDLIMVIEKYPGIIQSIFEKELIVRLLKEKQVPVLFLYSQKQK